MSVGATARLQHHADMTAFVAAPTAYVELKGQGALQRNGFLTLRRENA
jgi:hypothetical protein